jgi:hypothetical protein
VIWPTTRFPGLVCRRLFWKVPNQKIVTLHNPPFLFHILVTYPLPDAAVYADFLISDPCAFVAREKCRHPSDIARLAMPNG